MQSVLRLLQVFVIVESSSNDKSQANSGGQKHTTTDEVEKEKLQKVFKGQNEGVDSSTNTDDLKPPHEPCFKAESIGQETESGHSYDHLSEDNLSVDARMCGPPRTSSSHKKSKQGAKQKGHLEFEKDTTKDDKKGKVHSADSVEDLIRSLVKSEVSKKHEIKFFDAAIVYDKNDYEEAVSFREDLLFIAKSEIEDELRIELFDSEEFVQSKIMIVQDIIDRCSVVLVYLSPNFESPELNLFIEEAIGLSRLGYNDPEFDQDRTNSQRKWVLKPVHTQPRRFRNYKVPVGLVTVNGIDWFDRHTHHTIRQIISTLKNAVTHRKQRSVEVNTSNAYKDVFKTMPVSPPLGPPFNRPLQPATKPHTIFDGQPSTLISHPTDDVMSFPQSFHKPTAGHSNVRVDTQPSFMSMHREVYGRPSGNTSGQVNYQSLNRHPSKEFFQEKSKHQEDFNSAYYKLVPGSQSPQVFPQNIRAQDSEMMYQSAGLQRLPAQQQQQQQQQQQHTLATHYSQQVMYPPQLDTSVPQSHLRSPHIRGDLANPYQEQYLSQDAPRSNAAGHGYMYDQMSPTQSATQMSVISSVTGKLIIKPNLSTDNDIETDTVSSEVQDKRQTRPGKNSDNESTCSDDSESSSDDDDVYDNRRVVRKVVNIIGCKHVQLGRRNKVKEHGSKYKTRSKVSKKNSMPFHRTDEEDAAAPGSFIPTQIQYKQVADEWNNISISKDQDTEEMCISRDQKSSFNDQYVVQNRLSPDIEEEVQTSNKITETSFHSNEFGKNSSDSVKTPKLHILINKESLKETSCDEKQTLYSPDDNISEEQLFGSGPIYNLVSHRDALPVEAPFSFSNAHSMRKTTVFGNIVNTDLNSSVARTNGEKTFVYSDLD